MVPPVDCDRPPQTSTRTSTEGAGGGHAPHVGGQVASIAPFKRTGHVVIESLDRQIRVEQQSGFERFEREALLFLLPFPLAS